MVKSRTETRRKRKEQQRKRLQFIGFMMILLVLCTVAYLIWKQAEAGVNERPLSKLKEPHSPSIDSSKDENSTSEPSQSGEDDGETTVSLTFVGDVMLGSKVGNLLKEHGYDYPYTYVKEYLQSADITIANLEAPITERGEPQDKEYVYRVSPDALPALVESGIDVLNLANNHILDYGVDGLTDTFDYIDDTEMKRIGAGRDSEEAFQPVFIERNGVSIAFLGFSRVVPEMSWKAGANHPGVAPTYNHELPVDAIEKVKRQADLVVVIAHWGEERKETPKDYQVDLAHRYIDAGADLVVASHTHVLQGFEQYKGKWIAYNLGNFIFTTNTIPLTWETVILNAACSVSQGCELDLIPILTKGAQPKPMSEEEGTKLIERLTGISRNAVVGHDRKIVVSANAEGE